MSNRTSVLERTDLAETLRAPELRTHPGRSPLTPIDHGTDTDHLLTSDPNPPGVVEKVLLAIGWFLVERGVAVVLFFKTGEFH